MHEHKLGECPNKIFDPDLTLLTEISLRFDFKTDDDIVKRNKSTEFTLTTLFTSTN